MRVNPSITTATRGGFFIGANFSNFGTLPGASAAGLQMFSLLNTNNSNFRGVFVIDCVLPPSGNLAISSADNSITGRLATVVMVQSWRPRFRRPDLVTPSDILMRFTGQTLYSVPATIDNTTDVNAIGFTSGSTINERGVWFRDNELTISSNAGGTTGTPSGTLTYSTPSGSPFYFVSYTDRITDGSYRRDFVRSGVTATGFPNNYDEIASEVDRSSKE